jgi:hypothetical protein
MAFSREETMRNSLTLAGLIVASPSLLTPALGRGPSTDQTKGVPAEVRALEGTYSGAWTMYGINERGDVVKRFAWTDTLKTTGAAVSGDRAYVTWVNEQVFEGAKGPPRKTEGKEGYFLTKDGGLGDYFVETFGQTTRMTRPAKNIWTSASAAAPQELAALGFPDEATGQHVMVKVVTAEKGVETHRISRVSTVTWTDKDGKERVLQFISFLGYHKRQP